MCTTRALLLIVFIVMKELAKKYELNKLALFLLF